MSTTSANEILNAATSVFAGGFAFTKSIVHQYNCSRVGAYWLLSDAPRTKGQYRRDEWIVCDADPDVVDRTARSHSTRNYCISAIAADETQAITTHYKRLGYRLGSTEAVMIHTLGRVPRLSSQADILRVKSEALASQVNKAARSRQILSEHIIADAPLRHYAALVEGSVVGWVRSITVDSATWVSNLFVHGEYRRRGIGGSLMCRLLRDDRKYRSNMSVLTASHTGEYLYRKMGYQKIGTLYFFTPKKG